MLDLNEETKGKVLVNSMENTETKLINDLMKDAYQL